MSRKRVVFVVLDALLRKLLATDAMPALGRAFFESPAWAKAPNSTSRLSLVNYQSWKRLSEFEVRITYPDDISPALMEELQHADIVVVNQVASARSHKFVSELAEWLIQNPIRAELVFGTETTWLKEVEKGNISHQALDLAYFASVVLRHTAKTDTIFYRDERAHSVAIQEFELGIDTNVVTFGQPPEERNLISFARAPEARVTKNNDAIDDIKQLIAASEKLSGYELHELVPPYGSTEYWDAMSRTAFFIFTSDGETFSYCLNDAKATGAIALYPEHMYYNCVGNAFAVESYPWLGLKYSSHADLVSQVESLAEDTEALQAEAIAERKRIVENFSLEKVSDNWRKLLNGQNLNDQALYVYDRSTARERPCIVNRCSEIGARFAMPYLNAGGFPGSERSLTYVDSGSGVIFVRYYLSADSEDGHYFRTVAKVNGKLLPGRGPDVPTESSAEAARFLQLVCRVYKVGTVYVDRSLASTPVANSLKSLTSFGGLSADLTPMPIAWI